MMTSAICTVLSAAHLRGFQSQTRQAFQSMFKLRQPGLWIFGHWHASFDRVLDGTRFICLAELEYRDIEI
jgi:hypothetical protein